MSLLTQRQRARESTIELEGHSFTIRRPTDEEALQISANNDNMIAIVKRFVIGWDLTELDLVPGGGGDKAAFDSDLFADWVADQPALWVTLGEAILAAYHAHAAARQATLKN